MAFENVQITSTKTPPGSIVVGWREDLAIGDVLDLSLTSTIGVSSFRWLLVGRPEGSLAGGAGPEPIILGTGSSASFVVDNDAPYPKDGTYIVHCVVNEGSPTETRIRAGFARLTGLTTNDGRPLRMLGGFEIDEDTQDPLVKQGYNKALERWFRKVVEAGGGTANGNSPFNATVQVGQAGQTSGPTWDMMQLAGELEGIDPVVQLAPFDVFTPPLGATSLPSRTMCATMHQFGRALTIDAIACYLSSWTAGGFFGMAIYANATDGTLTPGAKLWQQDPLFDSGGAPVRYQEIAVTPNIAVAAGETLWLAMAASSSFNNGPQVLCLFPSHDIGLRSVGWKRPANGAFFDATGSDATPAIIARARNYAAVFGPLGGLGALSAHFVFPDPFPTGAGFQFARTTGSNDASHIGPALWVHPKTS